MLPPDSILIEICREKKKVKKWGKVKKRKFLSLNEETIISMDVYFINIHEKRAKKCHTSLFHQYFLFVFSSLLTSVKQLYIRKFNVHIFIFKNNVNTTPFYT